MISRVASLLVDLLLAALLFQLLDAHTLGLDLFFKSPHALLTVVDLLVKLSKLLLGRQGDLLPLPLPDLSLPGHLQRLMLPPADVSLELGSLLDLLLQHLLLGDPPALRRPMLPVKAGDFSPQLRTGIVSLLQSLLESVTFVDEGGPDRVKVVLVLGQEVLHLVRLAPEALETFRQLVDGWPCCILESGTVRQARRELIGRGPGVRYSPQL